MRLSIGLVVLPCALMAQTFPPRPAGPDMQKKLEQRLDWFQPIGQPQRGEWEALPSTPLRLNAGPTVVAMVRPPTACAIPLLRVGPPKGFADRMSVPPPPKGSLDKMPIPAPPVCEEWGR